MFAHGIFAFITAHLAVLISDMVNLNEALGSDMTRIQLPVSTWIVLYENRHK